MKDVKFGDSDAKMSQKIERLRKCKIGKHTVIFIMTISILDNKSVSKNNLVSIDLIIYMVEK